MSISKVPKEEREDWTPDKSSNVCLSCSSKFTTTNRRHHCRTCGELVCGSCSSKQLSDPMRRTKGAR